MGQGKSTTRLTRRQLRVLASPWRLELVARLEAQGPASARELGRAQGRSREWAHYHLKELSRAGLVGEAGLRPRARRPEKLYALRWPRLLASGRTSPELRARIGRAVLRLALREVEGQARDARGSPTRGVDVLACRVQARLTPKGLDRLLRFVTGREKMLGQEVFAPAKGHGKARAFALTLVVTPLLDRRAAQG